MQSCCRQACLDHESLKELVDFDVSHEDSWGIKDKLQNCIFGWCIINGHKITLTICMGSQKWQQHLMQCLFESALPTQEWVECTNWHLTAGSYQWCSWRMIFAMNKAPMLDLGSFEVQLASSHMRFQSQSALRWTRLCLAGMILGSAMSLSELGDAVADFLHPYMQLAMQCIESGRCTYEFRSIFVWAGLIGDDWTAAGRMKPWNIMEISQTHTPCLPWKPRRLEVQSSWQWPLKCQVPLAPGRQTSRQWDAERRNAGSAVRFTFSNLRCKTTSCDAWLRQDALE